MTQHRDAEAYIEELNPSTQELAQAAHDLFVAAGCTSYVKTIYVGYDFGGEMVAALYGHAHTVEIALALPENAAHDLLVDATHLTWRTLPVAAVLSQPAQMDEFASLVDEACSRITAGTHEVMRDNDTFIRSRRQRSGRPRR